MFLQGKTTAPVRILSSIWSGRDYTGKPLQDPKGNLGNTVGNYTNMIVNNGLPVPFGVVPTAQYLAEKGNPQKNALSAALIASGLAKYSADPQDKKGIFANPQAANAGNWMNTIANQFNPKTRAQQDITNKISSYKTATTANNTAAKQYAGTALKSGEYLNPAALVNKYGITLTQAKTIITDAKNSLSTSKYSDVVSKYEGMSKANRQKVYSSLSPSEQQTLAAELSKYGLQP
jgi:hypothetical protein